MTQYNPNQSPPPYPGYGAPSPGYGAPAPGQGAPAPGYGAPAPGYGAPAPGYGAPAPGYGAPADSLTYSGPPYSLGSKNNPPGHDPPGINQQPYAYGPPGLAGQPGYGPPPSAQQGYGAGAPGYAAAPDYAGLPGQTDYGAGPPGLPGHQVHINQQNTVIFNQTDNVYSDTLIVKEEDGECGDCYCNCKGRCGSGSCGLCCEEFWLCERGNKWYSPSGKGVGWLIVLILFYLTFGVAGAILFLVGCIILYVWCGGGN